MTIKSLSRLKQIAEAKPRRKVVAAVNIKDAAIIIRNIFADNLIQVKPDTEFLIKSKDSKILFTYKHPLDGEESFFVVTKKGKKLSVEGWDGPLFYLDLSAMLANETLEFSKKVKVSNSANIVKFSNKLYDALGKFDKKAKKVQDWLAGFAQAIEDINETVLDYEEDPEGYEPPGGPGPNRKLKR